MFKKFSVVICGLGVLLLTAGGAMAQTAAKAKAKTEHAAKKTGEVIEDSAITTAVKTKLLADSKVGGLKIDVDTSNGVVTLTGPVNSAAERAQALRLARNTKGVKKVVSKLTMAPKTKGTTGVVKEDAGKVKDKTEEAAEKTGQKTKDIAEKTGEAVTDASITTAVKTKFLAAKNVPGTKINVDTNDHIVTLTGTVKNAQEKAEAVRIARNTKGVKSVVDNLTVEK